MLTHLGDMPIETFLREYWQQKPLLIRQGFADFKSPVSGDDLAGMALEEEIESRLIIEQRCTAKSSNWQLKCGPFAVEDFESLPPSHWTLLVQAVDQWVPEVTEILDQFRFIPNWRLDDIMISVAPDGGSVGPHFDYYDVFLIQAEGRRRWQLGQMCDERSPRLEGTPLSILKHFEPSADWVLEPGDILYLPPQLAHWGVAVGDNCMTWSVGFRAPAHADILTELSADIAAGLPKHLRYGDPGLALQRNPGEISAAAIEQIRAIVLRQLDNPSAIASWLGRYMTESKYELAQELDEPICSEDWQLHLERGGWLERNLGARFAFYAGNNRHEVELYVDGQSYPCERTLAEWLCAETEFNAEDLLSLADNQPHLITALINQGSLLLGELTDA